MNKTFKTIWNAVRGAYVTVNETVCGASQKSGSVKLAVLTVAAAAALSAGDAVQAAPDYVTSTVGDFNLSKQDEGDALDLIASKILLDEQSGATDGTVQFTFSGADVTSIQAVNGFSGFDKTNVGSISDIFSGAAGIHVRSTKADNNSFTLNNVNVTVGMQSGVSETQLFGLWHDSGIVTVNGTATISVSNDATDIAMGYAFDSIHDNERPTPSPRQTTFTDTASISASSSVDGAWAAGIYMRANALDKPSLTFKKDAEISAHAASGEAGGIILNYSDYDSNNSTDGAKGGSVVFEDTSALTVDVSGKAAVGVLVDVGSLVVNGKADIKASSTENEYGIVIRGHGKATFNGETEVTATNALVLTPEDELDGLDWANDEIYNYGYQTSRHPVAEFKGTTTLNGALKQSSGTTINNTGTMTVKGDAMIAGTISGETGTLTLTTGTVTGNVIQDAIYVKGGSVILADSGHIEAKRIEIQSGKLTLEGAASLKTSSDQIFDAGLGIDGTVDNARNKKWGENLVFTGGTLTLTDEKYNASYADSVKGLIGSGTKVTYLGELVGGLTLDQAASIGGVHANTEIDAKGNVSDGKVSVDADVGGKTINVGSASKVEVTSNTTMTLVGNSGDELIIFSGTDDKAVDIQGTLKLGSVSVETSGKLTSTVNVEGTVAVENGSFDLTKLTTGTTSSTTAAIEVNKGSLNVGTLELNNGKATISVSDDAKMKVDELAAKAGEHIITGAVEVGKLAQDAAEALIRIGTTGENGESGLKCSGLRNAASTRQDFASENSSRFRSGWGFGFECCGHSENYYQRQHQRRENDKTDIR